MSETSSNYNLCSAKSDSLQVPIQLQISDDTEFLSKLLQANKQAHKAKESDDSSSDSELNCSDVVKDLDVEETEETGTNASKDVGNEQTSASITQDMINAQILSQLTNISQRLTKIESSKCKKTTDVKKIKTKKSKKVDTDKPAPLSTTLNENAGTSTQANKINDTTPLKQDLPDLNALRQNLLIQEQVDKRLKELAEIEKTGIKQKSLRGGPVEVLVPNRVKCPHEYVLSGSHKERISYDHLSITQCVAGFCRIMREEQNSDIQKSMLDYLISLMDDANDFSWDPAKASHAVLLCRMEQGEVKNYTQTDKIERIRRANAQRHIPQPSSSLQNSTFKKFGSKVTKSMPCQFFNQGSCSHQKSHETRGTLYKHICSSCFAATGRTFPHSEIECRNKNKKQARNE